MCIDICGKKETPLGEKSTPLGEKENPLGEKDTPASEEVTIFMKAFLALPRQLWQVLCQEGEGTGGAGPSQEVRRARRERRG